MSQSTAPWNADNFGMPSGNIGQIKLYNPADFQNNSTTSQFSGSAFQPFPRGGGSSTITEQPGKAFDTGQGQPAITAGFQSYNPNSDQPTNQVPPDKDSSGQLSQSKTNATMNGSWGWDPSWGEHSNSWFGSNSSNQYAGGNAGFGNSFDTQSTQESAMHYFDQNQNFPQNVPTDQNWSAINAHAPQQQPQQLQQPQQPQQQLQQPQQQLQQPQQQLQQPQQQLQQPQQQLQQPQQQLQQPQQQLQQPQQLQPQLQQMQQQPQLLQQSQQSWQQQQQLHHEQQQMAPPQEENLNISQNASLPSTTNVPQYLDVTASSEIPYSHSEYSAYNDYSSSMSLSTPSMGAPSLLSSPSSGQMSIPSDQQLGQMSSNTSSLSWPNIPTDSDPGNDQANKPLLPSNSGQHANMGLQPNASNYFNSQSGSDQSLWKPTPSVEENSTPFSLGDSAAGSVPLSSAWSVPLSVAGSVSSGIVSLPLPGSVSVSSPESAPLLSTGSILSAGAGSVSAAGLSQQPVWTDSSPKQIAGDCSVQPFQPYHINPQKAESYFGQNSPFLDGNSNGNANNTISRTIPMNTITQSFAQVSMSDSVAPQSIASGVSSICQTFTDVSLGDHPNPNPAADSSKTNEGTGSQLLEQNPQDSQIDNPQLPTDVSVANVIKHSSTAGDWETVPSPDSNQHSRQSSLGNAQFVEGQNLNTNDSKTATTISSSQPILPVNQAILGSFNITGLAHDTQPSFTLAKPSVSGQPFSAAPSFPSQTIAPSKEANIQPEVVGQHEAVGSTDVVPPVVNKSAQRQNISKPPSVETITDAAIMDSFAIKATSSNNSVPMLPTPNIVGLPKLESNDLLNEHKLNVYASEIQPRDSSPFQPPIPRQGSMETVHAPSTSRSSSQENANSSQIPRTSGPIRSGSDGGRSSAGSQSSGTRPPITLSRQSSHDSTRSLGSNTGARLTMEQIKELGRDSMDQLPLPSSDKVASRRDQTSAAIRATAAAEARVHECMSPMTTLWDNPQISVGGIHLIPSIPIPSLVGADPVASAANQPVKIAPVKTSVADSKPMMENPKNQSLSSEASSKSQPLTSTPNSSVAVSANSHDSSPIKAEQKSPTTELDETSMSERDYDQKNSREQRPRDRERDRDLRDKDPRDRDHRDRELRDRDPRDPDFRERDFHDSRESYDDYRELRDARRERDYRYMKDYERDYRSRYRSLDPKDPRYDPYYDRPPSRLDYDRYLEYQYYRDDPYERPRSRQDDSDTKSERSLSRAEYSRYKHKDMYSDYDPDYYSRNAAYYNYYRDRYTRGGYYDDIDSWYYHDKARRNHRPCYLPSYSQYEEYYGAGTFDGYNTSHTSREQSRAQTPAQEGVTASVPPHYLHRDAIAAYEQGQDMYEYYYSRGYYNSEDWSAQDEDAESYNQGRMTPAKFYTPHTCAVFGPGGRLIHVLPNRPVEGQPATVEIINVEDILSDQKEAEEFHSFPGPLIRGETHKNDVLLYCQNKAKQQSENMDLIDRESAAFLWKFLELLIKQNGTIVGTDIADLLLEGHQPSTADYLDVATKSDDELDANRPPSAQGSDAGTITTADKVIINKTTTATLNERTDRFRNLLLYGMKKDALRWAMKNNLWGHALFLASKMDNRTHADIMTRFANSAIQMNDPLQTLYQLMSGRQPASVTSVCDDNWGDWRPHLAMMLSNHSSRPELDKKSITTLGDTLAAKGCLHASHFCYLMAQVNFGTYSKKTSKIVLIGSSHSLPLNEFATNEAIQCTEIFEYAQLLGNSMYSMPSFQPYKLLYACRLADYGLTQEAFHYCEVIASTVIQNPVYYHYTVVKVLTDISNRLKCYDPQRLQMGDMTDPMWLQQLSNVCRSFEDGSIQPLSGSVTPLGPHVTANSSESGEIAAYLNHTQDALLPRYPQQMPVGGPYVQNSQLVSNYAQDPYQQYQQQQGFYDNMGQQQQQQQQQQVYGENLEYSYNTQQQQQQPQMEAVSDPSYAYQSQSISQTDSTAYISQDPSHKDGVPVQQQQMMPAPSQQTWQPQDPSQMGNQEQGLSANPEEEGMAGDPQSRRESTASIGTSAFDSNQSTNNVGGGGGFDYFEASTRKTIIPPTRYGANRQRTISESSNTSTGSVKKAPSTATKKADDVKQKPADQKSWWNIFSKLGGQRKKDMILPDDKNPAIVWDPDRQRWINTEEDDEPDTPNLPPPKDTELKPTPPVSAGPPPPNGNMFSRPRTRGARSKYVDVMNPTASSQAVPENLFNVLPSTTAAPPIQNIFIPSGANPPNESTPSTAANGQNEMDTLSPSYNHVTEPSPGELSRSSSMSSLSQEVHQLTRKQSVPSSSSVSVQQPMPAAPASGPMLYNPASFQNQSFASVPSTGPTSRLAQRRVYPK